MRVVAAPLALPLLAGALLARPPSPCGDDGADAGMRPSLCGPVLDGDPQDPPRFAARTRRPAGATFRASASPELRLSAGFGRRHDRLRFHQPAQAQGQGQGGPAGEAARPTGRAAARRPPHQSMTRLPKPGTTTRTDPPAATPKQLQPAALRSRRASALQNRPGAPPLGPDWSRATIATTPPSRRAAAGGRRRSIRSASSVGAFNLRPAIEMTGGYDTNPAAQHRAAGRRSCTRLRARTAGAIRLAAPRGHREPARQLHRPTTPDARSTGRASTPRSPAAST